MNQAYAAALYDDGSFGRVVGLAPLLGAGGTAGSAGITGLERRLRRNSLPPPVAGGAVADAFALADQTASERR